MTLSLFTSCSLLPSIEGAGEGIEMQCCGAAGGGGLLQTNNYGLPLLCAPTWLNVLQYNLCVTASLHYTTYFLCLPRHSTPTVHTSDNDTDERLMLMSICGQEHKLPECCSVYLRLFNQFMFKLKIDSNSLKKVHIIQL